MADWRLVLPLLLMAAFLIFEDLITVPSCVISDGCGAVGPAKLKAMIVADLLLKGPDAGYADTLFRNIFISRFFRKSYEKLEPDMLVILGDIAAKRLELGNGDWLVVLQQLKRVIGPFDGVPLVVGLGERDVGECSELDEESVAKIANHLPGLDRTGSASFRFENVSFFLINDVALLCNENALRFGVEKLIETESFDLREQSKNSLLEAAVSDEINILSDGFPTLKSYPPSGSGPVLLLHFPLSRAAEKNIERNNTLNENLQKFEHNGTVHVDSDTVEAVSPQLMQTLPLNETEYILQSLRPRMVFSAHRQHFDIYNHSDGTLEVTVPAMTWALGGRPGFVFASFGETNTRVSHCSLAREMHVVMGYLSILVLLLIATVISRGSYSVSFFQI
ncbi:hypothetical protein KFK09_021783 [Dendrobium nobile]|uniref:Calcineurin-like phosphoesterase domain-containing protein n=1 Tax=Dendrobium nobile TaxID=94219 RepID=A0A8T3AI91_DENNO|nr:hypothetical protein KFK09_021783 [Dendrobium nobile]